eukprot:5190349-Amphidinium_carterae.1
MQEVIATSLKITADAATADICPGERDDIPTPQRQVAVSPHREGLSNKQSEEGYTGDFGFYMLASRSNRATWNVFAASRHCRATLHVTTCLCRLVHV